MKATKDLFTNVAADGDSNIIQLVTSSESYSTVAFMITGSGTVTVTPKISIDGSNWSDINMKDMSTGYNATAYALNTLYEVITFGGKFFKLVLSSTSGTFSAKCVISN